MTLDMAEQNYKVYSLTREAKRNGISILPPSVNRSGVEFEPEADGIRYALGALKNMGQAAANHIVAERGACAYRDLPDLVSRINPKIVNKRALETLNAAGALEAVEKNRAKVAKNLDRLVEYAARIAQDRAAGQVDMFGDKTGANSASPPLVLLEADAWSLVETLDNELAAAGFYISGHPLDDFAESLSRLNVMRWVDFAAKVQANGRAEAKLAATVTYKQDRKAKSGNRFAFAGFSDPTGQFEAVIFSDTLALAGDKLNSGKNVLLTAEADAEGEGVKVRVRSVQALEEALGKGARGLAIFATDRLRVDELLKHLSREGSTEIKLVMELSEARKTVEFALGDNFSISPKQLSALRTLPGIVRVM